MNRDNPTPRLGPIEATNPCGEQPLLPYESCNLGSLNLSRFVKDGAEPEVDWDALAETIPVCVRFLDDVIDVNHYPIPEIEEMTLKTRKIGLGVMGWADLLFQLRLPYDSDEALKLGERMMAFIQEKADAASEELARERGVFPAWEESIYATGRQRRMLRNSTRTTVAPTGTLSIIADCSGGIEPVFSLAFTRQHFLDPRNPKTATKLTEVNKHFEQAAQGGRLPLEEADRRAGRRARASATSRRRRTGRSRSSSPRTTCRRSGTCACRPPSSATPTTPSARRSTSRRRRRPTTWRRAYLLAYHEGCKGITIYRDKSREMQVLSHTTVKGPEQQEAIAAERSLGVAAGPPSLRPGEPYRRRLPDQRNSVTHKFDVGDQEGYVTVGLYDDGSPGEVFVTISKEGSTIRGLMDSVAVLTSLALQYGVPLEDLARKFEGTRFEPYGFTNNPDVPQATSLVDYIFRWLEQRFGEGKRVQARPAARRGRAQGRASARQRRHQHGRRLPGLRVGAGVRGGVPDVSLLRL